MILKVGQKVLTRRWSTGRLGLYWDLAEIEITPKGTWGDDYPVRFVTGPRTGDRVWRDPHQIQPIPENATEDQIKALRSILS